MIIQLALVVFGIIGAVVCVVVGQPGAAAAIGGGALIAFFGTML